MSNYNSNLELYIQDVNSTIIDFEKNIISVIKESKRENTKRYSYAPDGEIIFEYTNVSDFRELKDDWIRDKLDIYSAIETTLKNLTGCAQYIYLTGIGKYEQARDSIKKLNDEFYNMTTLLVTNEEAIGDGVPFYTECYLCIHGISKNIIYSLMFISNVLISYTNDNNMCVYDTLTDKGSINKFAHQWNMMMVYSRESMGRVLNDFWSCEIGEDYQYYYFYNPIAKYWYISLNKEFIDYAIIDSDREDLFVFNNGYIMFPLNCKFFIGFNNIDTNDEENWFDDPFDVFGDIAIINSEDKTYIASHKYPKFERFLDVISNEYVSMKCVKNSFHFGDIVYLVFKSMDDKLYIVSEMKPYMCVPIDKQPYLPEEARAMYGNY